MATQAADPKTKITQAKLASTPLADVVSAAKRTDPPVQLDPPPGASAGLRAFVEMGETAIQTAVDLLGRGLPKLPPDVGDLLQPSVYKNLGEGEADKAYQKTIDKVEAKQMELLQFDNQIVKTSDTIASEQASTLRSIWDIVKKLQTTLKSAGTIKKPEKQEPPLLKAVADAVQRVYDKVAAVAALNENLANEGGGKNTGGGNTGGTATQGSGGDGLGSILQSLLPMAAMLPMMAMPLAQQIPEMLEKAEEDKQKKAEQNQNAGTPPPPGQAPPPGDPNATAVAAATPGEQTQNAGTPPPAGQAPPPGDPNAAAASAPAIRNASLRRRQPPAEGQPPSTLPSEDAEPDPEPSPAITA
ncbi:hypothetical protein OHB12_31950 [Nocardia sp. NBC_01730]|uniref:hypothetical protein n=1 Tax=Nocardia sp. NBC_01730 TaxID=2975998 RepID=UPI002E13CEC9|nr:hypothetical protein OHB12_31950 [Nocardia sp. NBC_01730]